MKILLIQIGIVLGTSRLCDAPGKQENCFRLENGTCVCCVSGWRMDNFSNCTIACANCRNSDIKNRCIEQCEPGHYGPGCDQDCPEHCAKDDNNKSICDKDKGHCSPKGCDHGFYGHNCEMNCSLSCRNECWRNGSCLSCDSRSYGEKCEGTCSRGCIEGKCNRDGSCDCKPGFDGDKCEHEKNRNVSTMNGTESETTLNPAREGTCSRGCIEGKCNRDGSCDCKPGFDGDKCEHEKNRNVSTVVWLLVFLVVIGCLMCFRMYQKVFKTGIEWLKGKLRRTGEEPCNGEQETLINESRQVDEEDEARMDTVLDVQEKFSVEETLRGEDKVFKDPKSLQGTTAENVV